MFSDKQNPLGNGDERAAEYQMLGGFDTQQNSQTILHLQVRRIRQRFNISEHLAVAIAHHAFASYRRLA